MMGTIYAKVFVKAFHSDCNGLPLGSDQMISKGGGGGVCGRFFEKIV